MKTWLSTTVLLVTSTLSTSCSDNVILSEALRSSSSAYVSSGDIFIVSGGAVAPTTSPYPIHNITQWSKTGVYIRTIATSPSASTYYYGIDLNPAGSQLYFTVDTVDRIDKVDLSTLVTTTAVIDANLTGTTMRALAALSDGGIVAAESTTSIEKFNSAGTRLTGNFPLTVTANINNIKRISGDRFVVLISGNPDNPRVYNNDGSLVTTLSGIGCTTNCDPYDIVELADGRFVVSVQNTSYNSLELFAANFTYIGQLYKNTAEMIAPGPLALLNDGNILVCTAALNTCEKIAVSGNTGSRVGTQAFIGDASLMRQPTAVVVVP